MTEAASAMSNKIGAVPAYDHSFEVIMAVFHFILRTQIIDISLKYQCGEMRASSLNNLSIIIFTMRDS